MCVKLITKEDLEKVDYETMWGEDYGFKRITDNIIAVIEDGVLEGLIIGEKEEAIIEMMTMEIQTIENTMKDLDDEELDEFMEMIRQWFEQPEEIW